MKKLKPANENPDFGKVCIHGSLKRQCYTCELEENNDWLKKVNQNLRDEIEKLNLELKQSKAHREQMSKEICEDGVKLEKLRDENGKLKAEIEKLASINPDCGGTHILL